VAVAVWIGLVTGSESAITHGHVRTGSTPTDAAMMAV
jgi:hypothetical protein